MLGMASPTLTWAESEVTITKFKELSYAVSLKAQESVDQDGHLVVSAVSGHSLMAVAQTRILAG